MFEDLQPHFEQLFDAEQTGHEHPDNSKERVFEAEEPDRVPQETRAVDVHGARQQVRVPDGEDLPELDDEVLQRAEQAAVREAGEVFAGAERGAEQGGVQADQEPQGKHFEEH